jgi:dipeptidyl aminopeptidase/acylaminoacyl peptidase
MNLTMHSAILLGVLAVVLLGTAVQSAPAPIVRSGPVEFDKGKKLWLYLPPDYTPKDKRPLIVYMHGRGGNMRTFEDSPTLKPFKDMALERGFAIICPEYGSDGWMNDDAEQYVLASIEWAQSRLGTNQRRTYLMGISMGGLSTLAFAVEHPDITAAMCEIVGITDVVQFWYDGAYRSGLEAAYGGPPYDKLKEYVKRSATYNIGRIKQIPTLIIHGEQDALVPVSHADTLYHMLKNAGGKAECIRVPGIGHSEVVVSGNEAKILDFFAAGVQPERTKVHEGQKWQPDW